MKTNKKQAISIFGLLLLSGAVAFPNLSDAIETGFALDANVNINQGSSVNDTDTELKIENENKLKLQNQNGMEVSGEVRQDAEVRKDEEVRQDDTEKKDKAEYKSGLGFFAKIWNILKRDESPADTDEESEKNENFKSDDNAQNEEGSPNLLWIRTTSLSNNSTTIAWITLEKSSSNVWITSDDNVDTSVEASQSDSKLSYFHKVTINDLEANTTYNFKVSSTNKDQKTQISTLQSFTTKVE